MKTERRFAWTGEEDRREVCDYMRIRDPTESTCECSRRIRCNTWPSSGKYAKPKSCTSDIDDSNRNVNTARQKKHAALWLN
ncbi:hypothetical protein EVAR_59776_1 [Eumeta japonica]|uniref:Uncharacterized protein n=1 Tax=Eumeta variegata TaxID=151549 RepID=A0A4C1ZJN4_EUMVA|nr:hypothetical protein EVAR_59776_1 [Eumeta japonica]